MRGIKGLLLLCPMVVLGSARVASAIPAPAGMGNYCSITWPTGGWAFASDPSGGDPCGWLLAQSDPGGTIQRKGLYASNNWNRVVYRCFPPNYGWVGLYQGWGNDPLTWAYNAAQGKPGCIFTVSPVSLPIFDAPFLTAVSYSLGTGFDYARPPYTTLDVPAEFGQPGSSMATIVDWKGRDRSAGYVNDHAGHDWLMPTGTPILAAADGVVIMARSWQSPCSGSDSVYQKEIAIQHTVYGANNYYERFVTYYAHLSLLSVSQGQAVTKGQTIGLSGNTGCSSAPHLHFGALRLTNTADKRLEALHFYDPPVHSDGGDKVIDPYGWAAPMGFDPWSWKAYPEGALSLYLWRAGQAPQTGSW
jgi:murein DD-endopeptidase MepM/ murein hydrolase activator NlpD